MAIGPSLPPHLQQKRKREDDPESSAAPTPQPLPLPASGSTKRRCVLGPSLPLESPGETAAASPKISVEDEASSDNESDFGPAPASNALSSEYRSAAEAEATAQQETVPAEPEQPQRDDWMLTPPTHGDWVSRVDPTKLRNRKFKTGKGTKAPGDVSSADNRLWTETPEQKRHRLEDEVMGVKKPAAEVQAPKKSAAADAEDRATERKIQEFNVGLVCCFRFHVLTADPERQA